VEFGNGVEGVVCMLTRVKETQVNMQKR